MSFNHACRCAYLDIPNNIVGKCNVCQATAKRMGIMVALCLAEPESHAHMVQTCDTAMCNHVWDELVNKSQRMQLKWFENTTSPENLQEIMVQVNDVLDKKCVYTRRCCDGCGRLELSTRTFLWCGGCHKAIFCDPRCLKVNWADHKAECRRGKVAAAAAQPLPATKP